MAHLTKCVYCPRQVINSRWCPECRTAHLGGMLNKIQTLLKTAPSGSTSITLPKKLSRQILVDDFETAERLARKRLESNKRAQAAELWKIARDEQVMKTLRDFEKEHPSPNPTIF